MPLSGRTAAAYLGDYAVSISKMPDAAAMMAEAMDSDTSGAQSVARTPQKSEGVGAAG